MRVSSGPSGILAAACFGLVTAAWAESPADATAAPSGAGVVPAPSLAMRYQAEPRRPAERYSEPRATRDRTMAPEEQVLRSESAPANAEHGYRGISSFFNIREAYSNVGRGEWEFEAKGGWFTFSNGETDEVELEQSIKYGITDDLHVELEVSEPLGEGGEGVGELTLKVFNTFWHETDWLPAFGGLAEMRIPTGYESTGVDGTFSGVLTKSLTDRLRVHFQGYVATVNGAQGGEDEDLRHFQWGVGPGLDYQCADGLVGVLNYLHKSSEHEGEHNNNILEVGLVKRLPAIHNCEQELKLAADIGLDGQRETPNLGGKLQWSVEWK